MQHGRTYTTCVPFMTAKLKSCSKSCVLDWTVILALMATTAVLEAPGNRPHQQCVSGWTKDPDDADKFLCGDNENPELQYPYHPNTVSAAMLIVCAFAPWIVTVLVNVLILRYSDAVFKCSAMLGHVERLFRMLMFSCFGTEAVVSVIKFLVGRPRPNFYALMARHSEDEHKQSRMSFPSGHSSLSFSTLFLLTLHLLAAMQFAQSRGQQRKRHICISTENPHSIFWLKLWWALRDTRLLSVLLCFWS